jgi:hypothetical protein
MYTSGRYSDLVIECKNHTFKVYRAVVCLQSDVFTRMVDGKFQVSLVRIGAMTVTDDTQGGHQRSC